MSQEAHQKRQGTDPSPTDPMVAQEGIAVQVMLEFEKYIEKRKAIRRLSGRNRRARLRATN